MNDDEVGRSNGGGSLHIMTRHSRLAQAFWPGSELTAAVERAQKSKTSSCPGQSSSTSPRRAPKPATSDSRRSRARFHPPESVAVVDDTVVTFGSRADGGPCPSAVHAEPTSDSTRRPAARLGRHSHKRATCRSRSARWSWTRLGVETETIAERRGLSPARSARIERSRAQPVREACHCETTIGGLGGCPDDVPTRSVHREHFIE